MSQSIHQFKVKNLAGKEVDLADYEGKVLMVVSSEDAERVLEILKSNEFGKEASIIGEIVDEHHGKGWITTSIGGKRIIDMLAGEQLPRIC